MPAYARYFELSIAPNQFDPRWQEGEIGAEIRRYAPRLFDPGSSETPGLKQTTSASDRQDTAISKEAIEQELPEYEKYNGLRGWLLIFPVWLIFIVLGGLRRFDINLFFSAVGILALVLFLQRRRAFIHVTSILLLFRLLWVTFILFVGDLVAVASKSRQPTPHGNSQLSVLIIITIAQILYLSRSKRAKQTFVR